MADIVGESSLDSAKSKGYQAKVDYINSQLKYYSNHFEIKIL